MFTKAGWRPGEKGKTVKQNVFLGLISVPASASIYLVNERQMAAACPHSLKYIKFHSVSTVK